MPDPAPRETTMTRAEWQRLVDDPEGRKAVAHETALAAGDPDYTPERSSYRCLDALRKAGQLERIAPEIYTRIEREDRERPAEPERRAS